MAILSSDKKSVTVEKGDTLWGIATNSTTSSLIAGSTTQEKINNLVKYNNITNANLIVIGQVIKLSGVSSSDKKNSNSNSNQVKIKAFGIQSNTERTMYVTWNWSKESETEHYQYIWYYGTGDGIWFIGTDSTTKDKQCTYSPPSNAIKVKFKVKPIAKKHTVNKKEVAYWTASWSTEKQHRFKDILEKPNTPSCEVSGKPGKLKLTAKLENVNETITNIEFEVYKNNTSKISGKESISKVKNRYASFSWSIEAGNEYKVRCRAVKGTDTSDWTDYVNVDDVPPSAPKEIIRLKPWSSTTIYISWYKVANATDYVIQYTTDKRYFDSNTSGNVKESSGYGNSGNTAQAQITGLETGKEYFFRVKAVKGSVSSTWTEIRSLIIGTPPSAPTTWSTIESAMVNDYIFLYWTHNTEDGSRQTKAKLMLYIDKGNGVIVEDTRDIYDKPNNYNDEDAEDEPLYSYRLPTGSYEEGCKIEWKIRTAGITGEWSDWSIKRSINIYAKPTVDITVIDSLHEFTIESLFRFPFRIECTTAPYTQTPVGYYLSITSNQAYKTVDRVGNIKMVNVDEILYSRNFDISTPLSVDISAGDVDLENNMSYTINCTVAMDSGLTAETSYKFNVEWYEGQYDPNAEIIINNSDVSATIRPYLTRKRWNFIKVNYDSSSQKYIVTTELLDPLDGISVDGIFTETGNIVYSGETASGNQVYFCMDESEEEEIIEGVMLSVYRREFDGSFTEILSDVPNTQSTYFHDPHPALDYARYRIVATDETTGAVSYYDVPAIPVGEKSVIIQWNEYWSSFNTLNEDEMEEEPASTSMLKLPYNIDVSDSYGVDVSLVKYIGRKRPVTYYGTQLGETSSWNVVIEKNDEETLYSLRRLALWTGDVYVREPSGTGYWANIKVSFSQNHCDVTIPVTLNITRVEGGI